MKTEEEIKQRIAELNKDDNGEWPDSNELLQWVLEPSSVVHEGAEHDRTAHVHDGWLNREKIFSDKWKSTNHPPSFLNRGMGTLLWLVCSRPSKSDTFFAPSHEIYRHLTQPEATAAASAIQWLGSNCGWCWLEDCIRACGFDIVRSKI